MKNQCQSTFDEESIPFRVRIPFAVSFFGQIDRSKNSERPSMVSLFCFHLRNAKKNNPTHGYRKRSNITEENKTINKNLFAFFENSSR